MKEISEELLIEYNHLYNTYRSIDTFLESHKTMTYMEFDYYSCRDFSLFSLEIDFDFDTLSKTIDKIISSLSSIKRIFAKPIIHLRDAESVLPVESVRTISQKTISYAATHSETISNVTRRGIKPLKLLTKVYEDNYSIYENVVFCNIIDHVLAYTRRNWRMLKAVIYNSHILELNLLERVNHLYHFLALGKLHTGYVRDFGKYYSVAKADLVKLDFVYDTLQPRLKSPIYRKNKVRNRALPVRKTNIFKMQKDYHRVYNLYRYMQKHFIANEIDPNVPIDKLQSNYFDYCKMLALFAIGNFNFQMDETQVIDLKNLCVDFTFKSWSITVKTVDDFAILFIVANGKQRYRILMIPTIDPSKRDMLLDIECKPVVSERFVVTPFEEDYLNGNLLCLSKEDIESFRRIQQYILKGMIYTDRKKEECPFCTAQLVYNADKQKYECESCRTIIEKVYCPNKGKNFYQTRISNLKIKPVNESDYKKKNSWLLSLEVEALMHYRNITKINSKGEIMCPFCNETHQ